MAEINEADIWFEDECHFQQHGSRCSVWVPPEEVDPVVLHEPTRRSFGVFGAVRASDGMLVTRIAERFSAASFLEFLKQLSRHRRSGRKMVIVLDNARWHRARLLSGWLSDREEWLALDYLPPYSPELNNIERVWKLTRRLCTHNRYFPELIDIVTAVSGQFELWSKPNDQLRRLCAVI